MNLFDIIIPVGPSDKDIIQNQIQYTVKNIIGYRNIYLILDDPQININGCIIINEESYPFNIETVAKYHGKSKRNGWYLQQLLKLYSWQVIPGILERYLVIDSDTFFLKPISFMEGKLCKYNYGTEYHKPYFLHMKKIHPSLNRIIPNMSGICHHMIFETKYIKELFNMVEQYHNDKFYNVFLSNVTEYELSGASEYEIYFNYMIQKHPHKIIIRKLNWANVSTLDNINDYDYVSYHWYRR